MPCRPVHTAVIARKLHAEAVYPPASTARRAACPASLATGRFEFRRPVCPSASVIVMRESGGGLCGRAVSSQFAPRDFALCTELFLHAVDRLPSLCRAGQETHFADTRDGWNGAVPCRTSNSHRGDSKGPLPYVVTHDLENATSTFRRGFGRDDARAERLSPGRSPPYRRSRVRQRHENNPRGHRRHQPHTLTPDRCFQLSPSHVLLQRLARARDE